MTNSLIFVFVYCMSYGCCCCFHQRVRYSAQHTAVVLLVFVFGFFSSFVCYFVDLLPYGAEATNTTKVNVVFINSIASYRNRIYILSATQIYFERKTVDSIYLLCVFAWKLYVRAMSLSVSNFFFSKDKY